MKSSETVESVRLLSAVVINVLAAANTFPA